MKVVNQIIKIKVKITKNAKKTTEFNHKIPLQTRSVEFPVHLDIEK